MRPKEILDASSITQTSEHCPLQAQVSSRVAVGQLGPRVAVRQEAGQHSQHERNSQDGRKQQFLLEVSLFEENQAAEMAEAGDDTRQRGDHAQLDQQGYED